jgi:D-glycero-D-manno-heptose 1,7-bisphosphate phosphatase
MDKAVFLDRDGTLIVDKLYLGDPDGVELPDDAVDAARKLEKAGYLLIVVSNQSGIGRGFFSEDAVEAVNAKMVEEYRKRGIEISDILFCPHNPEEAECECRKPSPKMILDAAEKLAIDVSASAMVGDRLTDPETGVAAGCGMNVLLAEATPTDLPAGIVVASGMEDAANLILDWGNTPS